MKKPVKIIFKFIIIFLGVIFLFYVSLYNNWVQNKLIHFFCVNFSNTYHTKISIKKVHFRLFNNFNFEDVLILDQQNDTLLFANNIGVHLTDWFFLLDKAEINNLNCNKLIIKTSKKDKIWNYDFLFTKTKSAKPQGDKNYFFKFELNQINLYHFLYQENNLDNHSTLKIGVESINGTINKWDLLYKMIDFKSIKINQPNIDITEKKINELNTKSNFNFSFLYPFSIKINNVGIKNATIMYNNNVAVNVDPNLFDINHIKVKNFNLNVDSFISKNKQFSGTFQVKLQEKCGFNIHQFKTHIQIKNNTCIFNKVDLVTNKSKVGNFVKLELDSIHPFDLNKLKATVNFTNSYFHTSDLSYFLRDFKSINKRIFFDSEIELDKNKIKFNKLFAQYGAITKINSSLLINNYKNKNINLQFTNTHLQTNFKELKEIVPSLNNKNLDILYNLNNINYTGNVDISKDIIKTDGIINSSIGAIETKLELNNLNAVVKYKGFIGTHQLNLSKLLQDSLFGNLDFTGNILGEGLSINTIKTKIEGHCDEFTINKYKYKNIDLYGYYERKFFNGNVQINDPNLVMESKIKIDLTNEIPHFLFQGILEKLNTKNVHLTNFNSNINAALNIDFIGKNIDNFTGKIELKSVEIEYNNTNLDIGDINIFSKENEQFKKSIFIKSNYINGFVEGELLSSNLIKCIKYGISSYLPKTFPIIDTIKFMQNFNFVFNLTNVDLILKPLKLNVLGFNNTQIVGNFNAQNKHAALNINIPDFYIYNVKFINTKINMLCDKNRLTTSTYFDKINLQDSNLFLKNFNITSNTKQDSTNFYISSLSNVDKKIIDIHFNVFSNKNEFYLDIDSSFLVFKENRWFIDNNGSLRYKNNLFIAKNLQLYKDNELIELISENISSEKSDLLLQFKNIQLNNLYTLIDPNTAVSGSLNGKILLRNVFSKLAISTTINVENFKNSTDSIGLITLNATFDTNLIIQYNLDCLNPIFQFNVKGKYDINDKINPLNATANFYNTNVHIIYYYLNDVFKNVNGNVEGSLHIIGSLKKFVLQGNLLLKKARFTVDYTNVVYEMDTSNFEFNNKGIKIKKSIIKDFEKNIGYVEGEINHQNFKNFYYDIKVNAENMMVLNTIKLPGDHFYGKAFAKSDFTIVGNENDLNFNLKATSKQNTFIHILNVDDKENGTLELIRFKKSIVAQNKTINKTRSKFSFNANLVLNNLAKIEVILDEVSNDIIECIGEGNIKLNISTFDPISMRGLYKIESGKYNLNFQSLLKTSFELTPNQNNYIEWTDKPLEANINIDARYIIDRINLNELIGGSNFSQNVKSYKGAIYVVAQLREKMYKPLINFKLEFPIGSPTYLDNEFTQFLNRLEKDENEMLKQVSFLIIFQSFAPINSIAGNFNNTNYNYANLGFNTISKIISKQINNVFTNYLYKITKDKSLLFDFGTNFYNSGNLLLDNNINTASNGSFVDRNRINFKVAKSFLNDKITLTLGNDIDVDLSKSTDSKNNNFAFLPNFNVEIILSKDRKLKGIVFYNNSTYFSTQIGKRNQQGVRISYQKDF